MKLGKTAWIVREKFENLSSGALVLHMTSNCVISDGRVTWERVSQKLNDVEDRRWLWDGLGLFRSLAGVFRHSTFVGR